MKRAMGRAFRATGKGLLILALPGSVRRSTAELRHNLPAAVTPAVGIALRIAVVLVIAGTVLAVHEAGHPLFGVAREVLLLLGALAILALSGTLAPQGRLLGRLLLSYAKRESVRKGLTWQGRLFRTFARRLEPATSEKEKGETNGHKR